MGSVTLKKFKKLTQDCLLTGVDKYIKYLSSSLR